MARLFGKGQQLVEELRGRSRTALTILVLVVVLVCFSGLLAVAYRSTRSGAYRPEYSGIVVEKWARYHETLEGSQPLFRLLIEGDNKARFVVDVDDGTYNKARPGMKITRTAKGIFFERL